MTVAFDKLKTLLEEKGSLSQVDMDQVIAEHGNLQPQEIMELESLKLKKGKEDRQAVTMEQYLEASKVLDTENENSEAYKKALAIVEAFEAGG